MFDRYGVDVLSPAARAAARPLPPRIVPALPGLVVEEPLTGWVGAITRVEKTAGLITVTLEDRRGKRRAFPLDDAFWIDGEAVALVRPETVAPSQTRPRRTASGSVKAPDQRAKVARAGRIWVEGRHDAELIEQVWGDDLREAAIVVELLDGVDHLADRLRVFAPTRARRVGVLVDHLLPGTKESIVVAEAIKGVIPGAVAVRGHRFIDIWQAVRPERLGLQAWPVVPKGTDFKHGTLAALGWPHADQGDVADGWHRILATVRSYRDLESALLAPVEELIDFVSGGEEASSM